MGRPSPYKQEFVERVRALASQGATIAEVAADLHVSCQTIYVWQNKYPDFYEALKVPAAKADERVELSLWQRANGYTLKQIKPMLPKGATKPIFVEYEEKIPPDPTSMIFWLKNRQPKRWRDRPEDKDDGQTTIVITGGLPDASN